MGHVISATVKQRDKRYQSQTTTAAISVQGQVAEQTQQNLEELLQEVNEIKAAFISGKRLNNGND